ncbi:MAG: class IV adenylate cyclase [Acidilobaceae archaeon]|nr:class IV adenylate cyclase [Acidilobaceae archaeon]
MIEVEGKYRLKCSALEDMASALERLGLSFRGEREEVDKYFSHPCRDFLITDEALRLRASGDLTLTYKGPRERGELKRRIEISAKVPAEIEELLRRLGFEEAVVIRKRRRYYEGPWVLVSLDEVEDLGCFVEIESKRGRAEDVEALAKSLGLGEESYVRKTYVELLLEKLSLSDADGP